VPSATASRLEQRPRRSVGAPAPDRSGSRVRRRRDLRFVYLCLLPALAVVTLFTVYPVFASLDLVLHENHLLRPQDNDFVGAANVVDAVRSPRFVGSLITTLRFTVLAVGSVAVLGIGVALLLNQPFWGARFLQVIILIPWAVPEVIAGVMWRWMFAGNVGVINGALYTLGLIDQYYSFFGGPFTAQAALLVAYLWKHLPLAAILLLAALQVIPQDVYDAARVDGAGPWRLFANITLPFLKPTLLVVLIFETVLAFTTFDLVFAMTGGGPANATTFIAWHAYSEIFTNLNLGRGAALGLFIALLTLVAAVAYWRALRTEDLYVTR
jgi:multiple sugar transport system permease protein